jgi:hypothetical protein
VEQHELEAVDFAPAGHPGAQGLRVHLGRRDHADEHGLTGAQTRGVWDPIKPVIVATEARNNANWRGGFDAGFLDRDRHLAYSFSLVRAPGVFVNVDQVKEGRAQERQRSARAQVEGAHRDLGPAHDRLDVLAVDRGAPEARATRS